MKLGIDIYVQQLTQTAYFFQTHLSKNRCYLELKIRVDTKNIEKSRKWFQIKGTTS